MDTFSPAINPSINGTQSAITPRVISTTFGDGYQQSAPDGLNTYPVALTLVWSSINYTDGQNLIAFLTAHVGVTFYYTSPTDGVQRKWQWSNLQYSPLSADVMTISVNFGERFDLVS